MNNKISKGEKVEYKSHSIQINLEDYTSEKDYHFFYLQQQIPKQFIYREKLQVLGPFGIPQDDPKEQYGLENCPHITLIYPIKDEKDYFKLREKLKDFGSFEFTIGNIGSFRRPETKYDVLINEIESPKLQELHKYIKKNCKNNYKFPNYIPHMTLAYVQKRTCTELEGMSLWTGQKYTCKKIQFSHVDGYFLEIPLT